MATNKIIMNWEEHAIEHQWLCAINLHWPVRSWSNDNCKVISWEMVDWAIMYIETDWDYYEHVYLDGVEYNLRPAIEQDNDMASWYLLWRTIFIWNNWPNPEQDIPK